MSCNNYEHKYSIAETIVTEPVIEPVTIGSVKEYLRITSTDHNILLNDLIKSTREYAESLTGRKFITQTWKAFYGGWPSEYFIIPFPTLQSVTHIKYTDSDSDVSTWDSAEYIVDTDKEPGRVTLGYSESWPSATLYPSNPIEIQFVCGYGDAVSDIPEHLKTMLKIGIERIYDRPHENYDKLLRNIWDGFLMNFKTWAV